MDERDQEAERMLAAFRAVDTFEVDRQRRVRRRLARSLTAPRPAWVDELDEPGSPRQSSAPRFGSPRVWWWGAAAAVVVALAAVAGGRGRAVRDEASPPSQASDRALRPGSGGSAAPGDRPRGVASDRGTSPQRPAPDPGASERAPAVLPRDASPSKQAPRQPKAESQPPSEQRELRLRLELERIDRIDAALRRGDDDAASQALAAYDRDFPRGQLREEAQGLRVLLACHRATPSAPRDAAGYLRLHPRSVLEGRIEQACAEAKKNSAEATDSRPPVQSLTDETP
ncbi:MAG: hypothetical protein AB1Z98_27790 [Nannocystaceae bacterium]